ncbi:hypothetical protein [Burkholderia sp. PU8-34]
MSEKNWPFPKVSPPDNQSDGLPRANEMRLLWFSNQAVRLGFEEKVWNTAMEAAENLIRRIPASPSGTTAGEICVTTHVNRMSYDMPLKDVMPELTRYASALAQALRDEILAYGYSVLRCSGTAEATGAQAARIRIEIETGLIGVG